MKLYNIEYEYGTTSLVSK